MVLELSGKTEMEGHVGGKDCTDDQLSNLLHRTPATLSTAVDIAAVCVQQLAGTMLQLLQQTGNQSTRDGMPSHGSMLWWA